MATSLDNLIDNYVQLKKDILFSKVNDEDLDLFIDMTKKELKRGKGTCIKKSAERD